MRFWPVRIVLLNLVLLLLTFPGAGDLRAQTTAGALNGVVTDPSGGVVAKAAVRLTDAGGASLDTTTNRDGFYEFKGLVPGTYTLKAVAKGFAIVTQENVGRGKSGGFRFLHQSRCRSFEQCWNGGHEGQGS